LFKKKSKIFHKMHTKAEWKANWFMYFLWFHWLGEIASFVCIFISTFDFVWKISDEQVRIQMTSQAEGMHFVTKFVCAKFHNVNLCKVRTDCHFMPDSAKYHIIIFPRNFIIKCTVDKYYNKLCVLNSVLCKEPEDDQNQLKHIMLTVTNK
jgi:hypothetical protein